MNILALESVSKNFGTKPLLEDVTFGLEHDEKMGVIGLNGSGKSTLLRLIAGIEPVDHGRITLAGGKRLTYLPQNPAFDTDQAVIDAVFDQGSEEMKLLHDYEAACRQAERMGSSDEKLLQQIAELSHRLDVTGGWDREADARAVLSRLGITDMDERVGNLSGGQRKRVALARALVLQPDLLILDEPTNHLDAGTIDWLESYLARYSGALLLVTHDRYFLDRVTNRMLEIENGGTLRYEGNYTYYLEKKEEQAQQREAESRRRAGLVRRELAWLRRGARARRTKQKAHVARAENLINEAVEGPERSIQLSAPSTRLGRKVIEVERVSKSYGETRLIRDFTYNFTREDRIGVVGPNGAGKTTLLEMIAGRVVPDGGSVRIGQTAVIGYYDQESRALKDDLRVIDYIEEVAEYVTTADGASISASQMLDRFLFPPAVQYRPIGLLSGGERRRLYLLRILMGAPNVLLLDEPTNDLDIPTLVALEEYLETFAGCLIVVSHDRYFLDRTVEHLFYFEGLGTIREYPGDYTAYREFRQQKEKEEAAATERTRKVEASKPARETTGPKKLSFAERRELEQLEKRIQSAELRKAEIERELAAYGSDFTRVSTLSAELNDLLAALDTDMERWAELAERAE